MSEQMNPDSKDQLVPQSEGSDSKGRTQFPLWWGLILFGLIATVMMYGLVRDLENQTARSDFATAAEQRMVLLDSSIQRSVDGLLAMGAFFDASPSVSRNQFKRLAGPILDRQKSLQALSWEPIVFPNEVKHLELYTRSEGFKDFELFETGPDKNKRSLSPRSEYIPVWFIEPLKGNEKAFGFDLGSNPVRRAAMEMAKKQKRPIATARITLVQETSKQFAFILFRPVFTNASSVGEGIAPGFASTPEIGRLKGYLSGVFRIGKMVEMQDQSQGDLTRPMQVYIFDAQGKPGEQLLYPQNGEYDSDEKLPDTAIKRTIEVGGRTWIAAVMPYGNSFFVDRTASVLIALAGVLLTLLASALLWQAFGKAQSIEKIVTERTRSLQETERRLTEANREAQEASRMKTVFLASMSHEFKTPMNAVLGLLHVLSRTPLNESQRDYVSKITGAAKRLLRLIEDILDVSRIEAGKLSIEKSAFKIETVFRDVLVAVSPKFRDSHVELIFDIDPTLPAQLIGDAMRLTQVMVNLVDNAAKFTAEGQIVVTIKVELASERRIYLNVGVKDSGLGMPQEECDRLFQPFVQAESMDRKRFGGTGLGLAICRQLVELMGGEIQASSAVGEGSHFQFSIPLGVDDPKPLCARHPELSNLKVLLLESHELAGESLERLLEAMGVRVTRVSSNGAASASLELIEEGVILVADHFPGAAQLISLAQSKPGLRPVQISSAGASAGEAAKYFEKPLLPHTILEILSTQKKEGHSVQSEPQQGVEAAQLEMTLSVSSLKSAVISAEMKNQIHMLKLLLSAGDPQSEHCAREFTKMAMGTELENLANRLLIQCNNYDFRKALVSLNEELPAELSKDEIT